MIPRRGLLAALVLAPGSLAGQSPALVPLDTIRLEETASSYLALPVWLAPDPAGGFYVVDGQVPQVIRYAPDGRLVRVYGAQGAGPGEFRGGNLAFATDSATLIVVAGDPRKLLLFDRESGRFLREHRLDGYATGAYSRGDTIWLGAVDWTRRTGVQRLVPPYDAPDFIVSLPRQYTAGEPLAGIFPGVRVTGWADTVLVGYAPLNDLLLAAADGTPLDTIRLPATRRRGVPPDVVERLLEALDRSYVEAFGVLSVLSRIHRLPDGAIAAVHLDPRPEEPPVGYRAFITVIAPDRRRACVDAEIPAPADGRPIIAFAGDTLLVLEQRITDTLDAAVFIARYRIVTDACDWIPLGDG